MRSPRILILAGIIAVGTSLAAYQAPAPAPTAAQLEVIKLKDNLFVIASSSPAARGVIESRKNRG